MSENPRRDAILERYPDQTLLSADGLDGAIIGVADAFSEPRLVYSVSKILDILMAEGDVEADGEDKYTDAREHFEFNIAGGYVGPQTPIFVEDEMMEEIDD